MAARMWMSGANCWSRFSLSPQKGSRYQIQAVTLGRWCLSQLTHLNQFYKSKISQLNKLVVELFLRFQAGAGLPQKELWAPLVMLGILSYGRGRKASLQTFHFPYIGSS